MPIYVVVAALAILTYWHIRSGRSFANASYLSIFEQPKKNYYDANWLPVL